MRLLNHITFAVSDLEKSFNFYRNILGLKAVARWNTGAYLLAGNIWIALVQDSSINGSIHQDYSHIAFDCSPEEFARLKTSLSEYGCQEWSLNQSEGDSFYFTDPDGTRLEIHVGTLESRLKNIQSENRPENLQLF